MSSIIDIEEYINKLHGHIEPFLVAAI